MLEKRGKKKACNAAMLIQSGRTDNGPGERSADLQIGTPPKKLIFAQVSIISRLLGLFVTAFATPYLSTLAGVQKQ